MVEHNKNKKANDNAENEKGYEALVKPIQDVIAKDWKVRLCQYLDIYIEYLHEPSTVQVNFTEAAVLVQNTSTYYCKRVDIMYNWVRQFCYSLAEKLMEATGDESEQASGDSSNLSDPKANKKKPKRNKNHLASEKLTVITFTQTSSKVINFKLEKVDIKKIDKVILNACLKTQSKPSACIPVQQSETEEMGYKDDFRLHWKIGNDGRLYDDFRFDLRLVAYRASIQLDAEDTRMDCSFGDEMDIDEVPPPNADMSIHSQLCQNDIPEKTAPDGTNLIVNQTEEMDDGQHKKKPEEDFNTIIPFSSLIMFRKFRRRQVFKLPQELIDEVVEVQKKRKKNVEEKGDQQAEKHNYHLSFSEMLGGKSENAIEHRLGKRKSDRLVLRKQRARLSPGNNNQEQVADLNNDSVDDADDNDFDQLMDDFQNPASPTPGDGAKGELNSGFEDAYEESARLAREAFESENDPLSITERVTAWHSLIQPVLAQAEARSVFSVNEYGTEILDKFEKVDEVLPFSALVVEKPREEICRYFLSTLMLANTYNLEIQKTDNAELSKDCLQMKLLTKVRHHEELDANVGAATSSGTTL